MNAAYFEDIIPCKEKEKSSHKRTYDFANEDNGNLQVDKEPRCSKRQQIHKTFRLEFITHLLENDQRMFNKAMSTPKAPLWKEVVNNKIESIMNNHTCKLVELCPKKQSFRLQMDFQNEIEIG